MSAITVIEAGIDRLSAFVFATVPIMGVNVQLIVLWLAVAMVFMTFWLGVPQIRGFSEAWRILRGRYWDPDAPGEVSQFAALTTALSGTIGLGNIAGIGVALTVGGPGAIFWMFVIGIFAMGLKCAEVTLGLMFREEMPGGRIKGGAWVTLERGLGSIGQRRRQQVERRRRKVFAAHVLRFVAGNPMPRHVDGNGEAAFPCFVNMGGCQLVGHINPAFSIQLS